MRRRVRLGVALALGLAAFGCLDALAPGAPRRVGSLGLVPVFSGFGAQGVPAEVDSIVVRIHHPPALDTTISVRILPGQDSIILMLDVPLDAAVVDTVAIGFLALHFGPPLDTLYRADSVPLVVRVGQPTGADTIPVEYVGPGKNIATITALPSALALAPGDSALLAFSAIDSTGAEIDGMPVFWASRDLAVAAVRGDGGVKARGEGVTWVLVLSGARTSVLDSARIVVSTVPQARIVLDQAQVAFTAPAGGAGPAPATVAITAGGIGGLAALALGPVVYTAGQATGWLTATLTRSTPPATLTLEAATGALAPGTYTAAVSVASTQAANSPLSLPVTLVVTPVPLIGLSLQSAAFVDTMTTGDPAAQLVAVTNAGTGTLGGLAVGTIAYGASQPTGWLTASLDQAAAPATLTLNVAKGSLQPGVYTATVPVGAAGVGNSPRTVAVTFDLRPQAAIGFSAAALTFTDTMTTGDPDSQTVTVGNAGTGTLSALVVGTITYGASQPTGWLTATLLQTAAPATLVVRAAKGALQPGTYTATVPVASAGANNSPQSVTVTFDVRPLPVIGLGAAAVTVGDTVLTGDPAAVSVAVTNLGTGTLGGLTVESIDYGTGPTGWLAASLTAQTAPAKLALQVTKGSLPAGTYRATVQVGAGFASNTPVSVVVTYDLRPSPLASLLVLPGFYPVEPGDTMRLFVMGFDAADVQVPTPGLQFAARTPGVATVDAATGKVTAVAAGTTVVLAGAPGAAGPVVDSALVAVPAPGQAVAAATANGSSFGAANVGDTVRVLVGVYLGAVSSDTLGSFAGRLDWMPGVLRYVSADTVPEIGFPSLLLDTTAVASGRLLFSGSNPAGTAREVIGFVYVKMIAEAVGGSPLTFTMSDLTAAITPVDLLPAALVLSGSVRVK